MKKRGQANVITLVLIIVLVLALIIIVWNVIYSTIKNSSEKIEPNTFTIKINLDQAKIFVTGNAQVRVSRGSGQGSLTGLKFVFYDKNSRSYVVERKTDLPNELETKIYDISASEINASEKIERVSVVPVFGKNQGMEIKENDNNVVKEKDGTRALDIPLSSSGLVSWLKFDETSGTTAKDSVGSNDGTITGTLFSVDPIRGDVFSFNGVDRKITFTNGFGLSNTPFTFSHWIKTNQNLSQMYTIGNTGSGNGYRYGLSNGHIGFLIGSGAGVPSYKESACGTKLVNDSNWHLITGVFDRGNSFKCYIDGIFNGSVVILSYNNMNDGAPTIGLPSCCANRFIGSMDDIMIFNRTLSDSEVTAIYYNQKK